MSASSRIALAAVALVTLGVVALALVLRPSSQPSPVASAAASAQPSDAAGRARFASAVHGISIDHPADWRIRAASEPPLGSASSPAS